jgi:uncharacterized repeat protein (TIGR03803 family)
VFKVNLDGTGFTTLHDSDGGPRGTLVLSGDTLYGTTESGGNSGHGTVFKINTDGTGFTNLETFADAAAAAPWAGLILSGSTLYGTSFQGGSSAQGAVFQVSTDGTSFTNLYSFTGGVDGAQPQAGLILAGEILYGTTSTGGSSADGTVFGVSLSGGAANGLTINPLGPNVVLTWPTNATGLTLQFATSLVPTVIWAVVSPGPTVVNGQNTITNPIAGSQKFYRLAP